MRGPNRRPDSVQLEQAIISGLLEVSRACGFAIWADLGRSLRYRLRQDLADTPELLRWDDAAALVITWHLARRAGEILAALPVTPARKPAARAGSKVATSAARKTRA